jgi:hypothetical protein
MKYDQFTFFGAFSTEQQETIKSYFSPPTESSIFKDVPLDRAEEFKRLARILNPGCRVRVRYRGKRIDSMRQTTLKRNANCLSIYVDY